MTRQNKCDSCRKFKIKCDERLPRCSGCIHRAKDCTHTYRQVKEFKFIESRSRVGGQQDSHAITRGGQVDRRATAIPARKTDVDVTTLPRNASLSPDKANSILPHTHQTLYLSLPCSKEYLFLAQWVAMLGDGSDLIHFTGSYGAWTLLVGQYMEHSPALRNSAQCFIDCRRALSVPTDVNLAAVRSSNNDAIRSICAALDINSTRACSGDILIAVQILYVVEAVMQLNNRGYISHVEGLIGLLKQHRKHMPASNSLDDMVSRVIFPFACVTDMFPAIMKGKDHELDGTSWLDLSPIPTKIQGLSESTVQNAWQALSREHILIPRLCRLVRTLHKLPQNQDTKNQAIELIQRLLDSNSCYELFQEAEISGQLCLERTISTDIASYVPMSYHFGSVALASLLSCYWVSRLFIYGLIDKLLTVVPSISHVFDTSSVHDEEVRLATAAIMVIQSSFNQPATSSVDIMAWRIQEMRLTLLLQASFGAWTRIQRRGGVLQNGGTTLNQARFMKKLCLDALNTIFLRTRNIHIDELGLEVVMDMFAGGPILSLA